jgi:DNA repair protein RecN (Recombination protein N)
MLQRLTVEHYALIEHLSLEFDDGLTVITGETGAGKSILLGALSLILGQRTDPKVIREGAARCVVEAAFNLTACNLATFFEENDLEYDESSCLLRREVHTNGKSRAFINDSPVSLSILKEVALQLIDIHSQHQNLLIGKDHFQLDVVDTVVGQPVLLESFQAAYQHYKSLYAELKTLKDELERSKTEEDYLRFQLDQLQQAALKPGELEDLQAESSLLTHAEEIKSGLGKLYTLLDDEQCGVLTNLHQSLTVAGNLKRHYEPLSEHEGRMRSAYIDLKDLTAEVGVILNDIEVNPVRLEQVNERINLLFSLQQKHHVTTLDELIALRDHISKQLTAIERSDDAVNQLQHEVEVALEKALKRSVSLSDARKAVMTPLGNRLTSMLTQLGMPKAKLDISQTEKPMDVTGINQVRFLFSANKQNTLHPIEEIASGGETSRIMLCIKSIMAESMSLSTLVFDEIDTGVSGEIAHRMGEIMQDIASNRQVICITHLPQIAVKGNRHIKVSKIDTATTTQTLVSYLKEEDRLMEIAHMLSGANVTDAAIQNAKHLLAESHHSSN